MLYNDIKSEDEIRSKSNLEDGQDAGVFDEVAVVLVWLEDDDDLSKETGNKAKYNGEEFAKETTKKNQ